MVFLSFVRGWWSTVLESSHCGQSEDAGDGDTAADTGSDLRERHQSQAPSATTIDEYWGRGAAIKHRQSPTASGAVVRFDMGLLRECVTSL
jgi:hypothetical protein